MVSVSFGFCKWLWPKDVWNARPWSVFTHEMATNERPEQKSDWLRLTTTLSKFKPWLLWMVVAQAKARGSCLQSSNWSDLPSQWAVTETIDTQEESIPDHSGLWASL